MNKYIHLSDKKYKPMKDKFKFKPEYLIFVVAGAILIPLVMMFLGKHLPDFLADAVFVGILLLLVAGMFWLNVN